MHGLQPSARLRGGWSATSAVGVSETKRDPAGWLVERGSVARGLGVRAA